MIGLDIAIACCAVAFVLATYRVGAGPTPADRTVAADLLTFSVIALMALIGTRMASQGTFDLVLVATVVAFLAAVSLARALTGGRR
ncbi:monovalent cation/H+ antiporter complex subunit F [Bogoriella caseilytica]|uniref:Multicomponent Na+:H+ antiporter subunit F n=1 Tax=Bogoriella caseilytica TaxID=56055 RepID=A0A3N2BAX6_9MICO|nr:monovalent cation/H+ antiporter complex subunit F [Bogoriella caseilytica]ROR72224.1 multicomponent Na+:H+ antiporter subunit F [Bogoriella caseilytica]